MDLMTRVAMFRGERRTAWIRRVNELSNWRVLDNISRVRFRSPRDPTTMSQHRLNELLKRNSRSFYLTLRVLPAAVRPQISLAYLLARASDTVADTEIVSPMNRLDALDRLRERILGISDEALNFAELIQQQGAPAERELLRSTETALVELRRLSANDLKLVREVLETIISGQELDLQRFSSASRQKIIALQSDEELDDYTFRVAGCVGRFWTRLCAENVFSETERRKFAGTFEFEELGVRFGKGLQLVNILRDLPADLRNGRCYIPADKLREFELTPPDLLHVENESRFRPLYDRYLNLAESHLAAGWEYTNQISRRRINLRLACAWPILIGMETMKKLRAEPLLEATRRVKVSRAEVRGIIVHSVLRYPFKSWWRAMAEF
jgi:farnesyl-diphosphate farnesyltransferase